ncbi:L-ascorbate oxidase [Psidium guajava]|nr:L-ascorbate oxidase [Psidium guajava]
MKLVSGAARWRWSSRSISTASSSSRRPGHLLHPSLFADFALIQKRKRRRAEVCGRGNSSDLHVGSGLSVFARDGSRTLYMLGLVEE